MEQEQAHTFEGEYQPKPYPYFPVFDGEYNPYGDGYI